MDYDFAPMDEVSNHHKGEQNKKTGACCGCCSKKRMGFSLLGFFLALVVIIAPVVTLTRNTSKESKGKVSPPHVGEGKVSPLHVGAFNIKRFGKSVMRDVTVAASIVKICQKYDIILIQEVRDSSNTALRDLNHSLSATGEYWHYVSSAPLGRSKYYKEQYVFFYKLHSVRFMGMHQVNDTAEDVYEREPFAVDFEYTSVTYKSKKRIILLALHTKPTSTKEELQRLPSTIRSVSEFFPHSLGVITLGDLNADCTYVNAESRKSLEIFNGSDFKSLIPHDADTTVSRNTDCAYDRVILYGNKLDVRQASVFNFETALNLNETEAADISDHYPVEFNLY